MEKNKAVTISKYGKESFPTGNPDSLYSISAFCRITHMPRSTAYLRAKNGIIKIKKANGHIFISEKDIMDIITSKNQPSMPSKIVDQRFKIGYYDLYLPTLEENSKKLPGSISLKALFDWTRVASKHDDLEQPNSYYHYRYADILRETHILLAQARSYDIALARSARIITGCKPGNHCQSLFCTRCKERRISRLVRRFSSTDHKIGDLFFITLIAGVVSSAKDAEQLIDGVKSAVDLNLDQTIQVNAKFSQISFGGMFELEPIREPIGTRKRACLVTLGYKPEVQSQLNAHAHIIIHAPGLSKLDLETFFRQALARVCPSTGFGIPGQVRVDRLRKDITLAQSVANCAGYALKAEVPVSRPLLAKVRQTRRRPEDLPITLADELHTELIPMLRLIYDIGGWAHMRWNRSKRAAARPTV